MTTMTKRVLHGIPDIRLFFHRNETPIYFVSATNFNLLGHRRMGAEFSFHQLHRLF